MPTIRVAILHHALGRFGGAEKTAILHSIYMKKLGFDTELFYDGPLHSEWKQRAQENIKLNKLPFGFPPSPKAIQIIEKLIKHLKTFDAVLIHHHICPFLAYYLTVVLKTKIVWYCGEPLRALWEKQLSGITSNELSSTIKPTSIDCYGKSLTGLFLSSGMYSSSLKLLRVLDKKTANGYTKIIVNSKYTRNVVKEIYNPDKPITVAYPGIETGQKKKKEFENIPKKFILAIGAMIPMKNYINLLRSYHQLLIQSENKIRLVIIGDGPLKQTLQSTAKTLGLNNIIFNSNVEENELVNYYKKCMFIVHLARHEPFGLVPLEAAIFGKPSIVSNQGGTKEFIKHGENGFLVNPQDPSDVAKHMKRLIDDEDYTIIMGSKAKERALKEFTIEKSTERLVDALKQLKNHRGRI